LLLRDLPELPEDVDLQLQHLHRPVKNAVGPRPEEGTVLPLILECLDREFVQVPDGLGLLEAVREYPLAVHDRAGIAQARQDAPLGHLEQELVPGRHRVPERVELEVLGQHVVASRRRCYRAGTPRALKIPPGEGNGEQVTARHCTENCVAQLRLHGEVLVPMQQEDLHEPIRSIRRS
jgi:hypothetical protein